MVAAVLDPDTFLTVVEAAADDLEEQLQAEHSFRSFVGQAWPIVEPTTPLVPGFYLDAICEHLQAVADHTIRRLLITVPPGFAKSTLVSVLFPAWRWIDHPEHRFLTTSHDSDLSMRDAVRSRRVMISGWYRQRWGDRFAMTTDQNVKTRYENNRTGHRISAGVRSGVTGKRADTIICDDPHNVQDAASETVRRETIDWWHQAIRSRLNDPKSGARIVIQQRVHEDDLAGVVADDGYEHLNLPMEYESTDRVTGIGWSDPRTHEGELLHPERYGATEVDELKREIGSYAYASQYQQRPAPAEGGILKAAHLVPYDHVPVVATRYLQFWDTAYKEAQRHDYSVCLTVAVSPVAPTMAYIVDVWRDRVEWPALEAQYRTQVAAWHPHAVYIEDKGSGTSLLQHARTQPGPPAIGTPADTSKIERANLSVPHLEAARVGVPTRAHWREAFITEITEFPNGTHDDQVDTLTAMVLRVFGQQGGGVTQSSYRDDPAEEDEEL